MIVLGPLRSSIRLGELVEGPVMRTGDGTSCPTYPRGTPVPEIPPKKSTPGYCPFQAFRASVATSSADTYCRSGILARTSVT